ncbi:MAG: butyrate kinase [Candidatus Izemoplasma sp.]|nr:butyrate kinase [Candidatus Izemoplasma sp.]
MKILTINPGSTSTKVALFEGDDCVHKKTIRYSSDILNKYDDLIDQIPLRRSDIETFLKENAIRLNQIDGFIGRGGLMKSLASGVYEVDDAMKKDLASGKYGEHASNLGGILADTLAKKVSKKAYIADPVIVDEMEDVAKISGLNGITRKPIWHALNQKAVAKQYAEKNNLNYEDLNLIVAHLGGGISVGFHKEGKVVDVNNALDGDGPFSPERTGGLPVASVYELAFNGQYTLEQVQKLNHGFGGLVSYLNTNDAEEVSEMIASGSTVAKDILHAMVYQIAKEIGSLYAITKGKLDAIIITGGLAYNQDVLQPLLEYIDHLGEITIYPGENELSALAYNMKLVIEGKQRAQKYDM